MYQVFTTENYPNCNVEVLFNGSYYSTNIELRVVVWYPLLAKTNYNLIIECLGILTIPSPYTYVVNFTKYKVGRSIFLMGLSRFGYVAVNNNVN